MNHEHQIDYARVRANLKKVIIKIATEGLIGNLLGFAFIVFTYSLLDSSFRFNIYFVLFGAILYTIGKIVAYYLTADNAIKSSEAVDILKNHV